MAAVPLPDNPSIEQLRKQAKDLRDFAKQGIPGALDLIGEHHPDGPHAVTLAGAQLVVARHYGFSSWARLKHHLEVVEHYRREPDLVEAGDNATDEFLALACVRYGDDSADRWKGAARLLADHPELARENIYVAAATADVDAARALLQGDPSLASAEGGPYRWEPILYLAFARQEPGPTEEATLATARLLIEHGGDPNAGYLWHGLPSPFTALTGALGSGEDQLPEHPNGLALARLLLDLGADPNDSQGLYNRQFNTDNSHLELLLERGLGRGSGGPWRARLGNALDSPEWLLRVQLWWAIVHDMRERVELLARYGVDLLSPYTVEAGRPSWARTSDGRTPAEVAALAGCPELVDWLVEHGATRPLAEGVDGFIAAAMRGDRAEVERLAVHADAARSERPALIVWAASRGNLDAISLLAEHRFDVNALGRTDVPMEQAWETALHEAAGRGDLEMARLLLGLGADPNIEDFRFKAPPLGWAQHFDQPAMIAFLEPLTG